MYLHSWSAQSQLHNGPSEHNLPNQFNKADFLWSISLQHHHTCSHFFPSVGDTCINPFLMNYSQDAAWQKLDWEKFMNCSFTERAATLMDDWQAKHKETSERQSANASNWYRLFFTSPLQPLLSLFLSLSLSLSADVYGPVTMATSPQEQRRRDLPWFRQISIPGLIYDALFRDYDTDERSNVYIHTHVWT